MHARATLLIGLLLALVATPVTNANHHPTLPCPGAEAVHSYFGVIDVVAYGGLATGSSSSVRAAGMPTVIDSCTTRYDGEAEIGFGGGRFPAGTSRCLTAPEVPHHAYGNGAQYWADVAGGSITSVVYSAGADGPALVQVTGCETDGVISDDHLTNPGDCASGAYGIYSPAMGFWTPATLAPNYPWLYPNSCNPFDGYVWVSVYVSVGTMLLSVDVPIMGDIWS